jgi:hypothetical protein
LAVQNRVAEVEQQALPVDDRMDYTAISANPNKERDVKRFNRKMVDKLDNDQSNFNR